MVKLEHDEEDEEEKDSTNKKREKINESIDK